jgi:hypothetical protein
MAALLGPRISGIISSPLFGYKHLLWKSDRGVPVVAAVVRLRRALNSHEFGDAKIEPVPGLFLHFSLVKREALV